MVPEETNIVRRQYDASSSFNRTENFHFDNLHLRLKILSDLQKQFPSDTTATSASKYPINTPPTSVTLKITHPPTGAHSSALLYQTTHTHWITKNTKTPAQRYGNSPSSRALYTLHYTYKYFSSSNLKELITSAFKKHFAPIIPRCIDSKALIKIRPFRSQPPIQSVTYSAGEAAAFWPKQPTNSDQTGQCPGIILLKMSYFMRLIRRKSNPFTYCSV